MQLPTIIIVAAFSLANATPTNVEKRATVQGFDISHYQGTVNFQGAYTSGARFVIIKVGYSILPNQRTRFPPHDHLFPSAQYLESRQPLT